MQGFTGQLLMAGGILFVHTIGFCGPQYVSPQGAQGPQGPQGPQGEGKQDDGKQGDGPHETILIVFENNFKILKIT